MRYKFTLDFVIQVATLEVIWFSEAKTLNNTVSLVFSSEKMDFNHNFFFYYLEVFNLKKSFLVLFWTDG